MKRWFWLNSNVKGTEQTQKETLKVVAKRKKVAPETLYKLPKLRQSFYYLIDYYLDIACLSEINHSIIKDWSDLNCIKLSHFELKVLTQITLIHNAQRSNQFDTQSNN